MFEVGLKNQTLGLSYWSSNMFNLGLYFQILDVTKTKVLLNLGSKKFCDSVLCNFFQ